MDALRNLPPDEPARVPYFSIVLTTYRRAQLLRRTIASVLAQTYTDYELIIVDDASPDNTAEVVRQFVTPASAQPHVRYLRQPTNRGAGAVRNVGIAAARGDLIVFLDDDDTIAPDFLEQIQRAFSSAPATVGFAIPAQHILQLSPNGEIMRQIRSYDYTTTTVVPSRLYVEKPIGGASALVVRTIIARQVDGFDPDFVVFGDREYMLRLAGVADMMVIPQAILYVNSLPHAQLSTRWLQRAIWGERLADKHSTTTFRDQPTTLMRRYVNAARLYYANGDRAAGRRCLRKAMLTAPFALRPWKFLPLLEANKLLPNAMRQRVLITDPHAAMQEIITTPQPT